MTERPFAFSEVNVDHPNPEVIKSLLVKMDQIETIVITPHIESLPLHCRVLVVSIQKSRNETPQLNIHLRHISTDVLLENGFVYESSPIGSTTNISRAHENEPILYAKTPFDSTGGHCINYIYTGDPLTTNIDLTITNNEGSWNIGGTGLNPWDDPQRAWNYLEELVQKPEKSNWVALPLAS